MGCLKPIYIHCHYLCCASQAVHINIHTKFASVQLHQMLGVLLGSATVTFGKVEALQTLMLVVGL